MNDNVKVPADESVENAAVESGMQQPQPMMMDLPTAINTVIARTEATSIAVAVINAFLTILQQRDPAMFTTEELARIQETVNIETNKTDALYAEIEKALAANVAASAEEVENKEA